MKKKTRALSLFLTALMATSIFVGCGKGGSNDDSSDKVLPQGVTETDQNLIKNFQSDYTILLPETPSKVEKIAGDELQSFLYQAAGYQMPIALDGDAISTTKVISIGKTSVQQAENGDKDYLHINRGGYNLDSTDNGDILLVGTHDEGQLFGVYGLLKFLIDFESYAIDYNYYSKSTTVKYYEFDNYSFNPTFPITILAGPDGSGDLDNLVACARQGRISSNWMGYNFDGMFWGGGLNCHTAFKIIDKSWFDVYPEWFVEADGKRKASNLCLTNPGLREKYIENLTNIVKQNTYTNYFMLGNEDNRSVCACADCSAAYQLYGGASGLYCVFLNDVSRTINAEIAATNPERGTISFFGLGYFGYVEPPIKEVNGELVPYHPDVVLDPSLGIEFCQHDGCQSHAIDDPDCPTNRTIARQLRGWDVVCSNVAYYGYPCNYRDLFLMQNDWDAMKPNAQFLHEIQCEVFYVQGNATSNGPIPWIRLKNYIRSKLARNMNEDVEELAHNFFQNYYGSAGDYVERYWNNLRNNYKTMHAIAGKSCWAIYEYMLNDWRDKQYWDYNWMKQQQDILNEGKRVVESDPNLTTADKKRILDDMLSIYLPLEYRILKDYSAYYTAFEHQAAKQKFFDDCHSLNIYDRSMFADEGTPDNQLDF